MKAELKLPRKAAIYNVMIPPVEIYHVLSGNIQMKKYENIRKLQAYIYFTNMFINVVELNPLCGRNYIEFI